VFFIFFFLLLFSLPPTTMAFFFPSFLLLDSGNVDLLSICIPSMLEAREPSTLFLSLFFFSFFFFISWSEPSDTISEKYLRNLSTVRIKLKNWAYHYTLKHTRAHTNGIEISSSWNLFFFFERCFVLNFPRTLISFIHTIRNI